MANKFIDQNGLRYFFSKLKRMFEEKADKSSLKTVATSGKYSDLEGKPEIIDNLTTNVSDKPLSAAQGVELKSQIDTKVGSTEVNNAISTFFSGKTVVFSNAVPTVDDENIITFVKRSG